MESLHGHTQENTLTIIVFNDKGCHVVRNAVPIEAYSNPIYRRIAERAYAFYDVHKKPIKDHIIDELQHELEGEDSELYEQTLRNMDRLKENINVEYSLTKIDDFNRVHALRKHITEAATALDSDDIDGAEQAISNYHAQRRHSEMEVFSLANAENVLLHHGDREIVPLGIRQYEMNGIGPCRKELFLFGGPAKAGKSWFLNHVSRNALFHGWKVLYVTLEMSAPLVIIRMVQNLLSLPIKDSKNKDGTLISYPQLIQRTTGRGKIEAEFGADKKQFYRKSILRPEMVSAIGDKMEKMTRYVNNFKVVERPTGSLTMTGLEAILDRLESTEGFVPDVVVLDYIDLMHVDQKEYRLSLGDIHRRVRGLASQRNMAVVSATQLRRSSIPLVTRTVSEVAEDYSKVMTCDQMLIYSQTKLEEELGIARLSVGASRHGNYSREIVISQCYEVGQFLIQAMPMAHNYIGQYYSELKRRRDEQRGQPQLDEQEEAA